MQTHINSNSVTSQDPSAGLNKNGSINVGEGLGSSQAIQPPTTAGGDPVGDPNEAHGGASAMELEATAVPAPPSNILFAENLPSECNEMMLAMLFRQYMGYKEVRIPRAGLAFIEFDDEPHATLALNGLNGFNITSNDTLDLKYSK